MPATNILKKISEKGADLSKIEKNIVKNPDLIPELVSRMKMRQAALHLSSRGSYSDITYGTTMWYGK